jgi:hypothetical protein
LLVLALANPASGSIVHVPAGQPTVQAGIAAAAAGDTVLVSPGIYTESGIDLAGKNLTIASHFLTTLDSTFVAQTILDGGGSTILTISNTSVDSTAIVGLAFYNGADGISANSRFRVLHSRFVCCDDGIDYESGSGGICRANVFESNSDDGIDLDDDVDILIEENVIRNNGDDGIEIRLHSYSGPVLTYSIRYNEIYGNGEDGIQLIDYAGLSPRTFLIERNLIYENAMAGLGCMADGNSQENYEGASIPEPILLANNVFDGNNHGITGGDAMTAVNNIVINSTVLGMKNVDGGSTVSYSCLWQNGADFEGSNVDLPTMVLADPILDASYRLLPGSPCIDAGDSTCADPNGSICDIGVFPFESPPVGVSDFEQSVAVLRGNRPNPFSDRTLIPFELRSAARVTLEVYDIRGRRVRTLLREELRSGGPHFSSWDGRTDRGTEAFSGIYFYRLAVESTAAVRRLLLLRGAPASDQP